MSTRNPATIAIPGANMGIDMQSGSSSDVRMARARTIRWTKGLISDPGPVPGRAGSVAKRAAPARAVESQTESLESGYRICRARFAVKHVGLFAAGSRQTSDPLPWPISCLLSVRSAA